VNLYYTLIFSLYPAQIQAKGNSIVEATIKIVKNGSYSFNLGETELNITVYVAPYEKCQQAEAPTPHTAVPEQERKTNRDNINMPQGSATPGEGVQSIQPFHHESTSPTADIEQVCEGY
jgi:hypothetical protein